MVIIDMEMPQSCRQCRMIDDEFGYCHATGNKTAGKVTFELWDCGQKGIKPDWCPLIEVNNESKRNYRL